MLNAIKCTLLPGKFVNNQKVPELYNAAYLYWKNTWTEFFEKAGSPPGSLNIENFMRQSVIITLHREGQIAGMLLSTVFNLSSVTTFEHPCITPFPKEVQDLMRSDRDGMCSTGEYLSVHPEFRKSVIGISLAEVLVGLYVETVLNLKVNYALAATVRPAKVDKMAANFDFKEVGSYLKCGVDCIMIYNTLAKCKRHSDPSLAATIEQYWKQRKDETGLTQDDEQVNYLRAA